MRRREFASLAIEKISELDNLISKISDEVRKAESAIDKIDKNINDISLLAEMPSETKKNLSVESKRYFGLCIESGC